MKQYVQQQRNSTKIICSLSVSQAFNDNLSLTGFENSHILWRTVNEMNRLSLDAQNFIQEINELWEPVYPYLAKHISEANGRKDGVVLEIGPFCGVIYSLMSQGIGSQFMIGSFPPEMTFFFSDQIRKKGLAEKMSIVETDQSLTGIHENSVDLVIFRGALFFPSIFRVDYRSVKKVLMPGGVAMIGGGFGKFTPGEVILPIAERSKDLNLKIGKIEVTAEQIKDDIKASGVTIDCEIIHEGGLWVILHKG